MSKTLQWIIGISVIVIALAFAFSAVWPFVAPNFGWAGYNRYGMMGGASMMAGNDQMGMMSGAGRMGMMGGSGTMGMMNGNNMMGMTLAPARCAGANSSISSTMHTLMLDIFAQKLDLTRAELDGRLADGETLAQIAATQDISWAEIHQAVMDEAVAAGYVTQAHATQMLAMMGSQGCPFAGTTPTP